MGNLVYCPTCGAKISVNADACPQCGEKAFFERRERRAFVDEPCGYGRGSVWQRCAGRGYYYAGTVVVSELVAYDEAAARHLIRLRDGIEYWFSDEVLANGEAMEAVRSGQYEMERWDCGFGDGNCDLFFNRKTCPKCRGRGKVRVEKTFIRWEDIRKPVE